MERASPKLYLSAKSAKAKQKVEQDKAAKAKANKEKAQFVFLENQNFESITSYNHLLLSVWFYELFNNYKYILIYQLDCFVFKDELTAWVNKGYSYIGAPWVNKQGEIEGVGNGGFSLRNVNDSIRVLKSRKKIHPFSIYLERAKRIDKPLTFIRAIKNYLKSSSFRSAHKNELINEDKTFAHATNRLYFFKASKGKEAVNFAFEKEPSKLFKFNSYELPFGCHAWWKYDLDFYKPFIEQFGYQINDRNE